MRSPEDPRKPAPRPRERRSSAAAGPESPAPEAGFALDRSASDARFTPLDVSADRILRTQAGLRPYRPSGYVVRREQRGEKILVHNYGHGGAGVTLSWGTAAQAIAELPASGVEEAAVLGAGAVGLATARLLQSRGIRVTIYARELPADTTSSIAGALWFPASICDPERTSPEFNARLAEACRISHCMFTDLVTTGFGICPLDFCFLSETPERIELSGGRDLYPNLRLHRNPSVFFGATHAEQFSALMIDTTVYLDALLRQFLEAGGRLERTELDSLQAVLALPQPVIMNCTGLGARELIGDHELVPVKGQLVILGRQAEIDYGYVFQSSEELLYMFPRTNEIVLGGTMETGNWSRDVDRLEVDRILEGHRRLASAIA